MVPLTASLNFPKVVWSVWEGTVVASFLLLITILPLQNKNTKFSPFAGEKIKLILFGCLRKHQYCIFNLQMQVQSSKTYSSALNFSALDPARCHLCSAEVHHVVHRWCWLRWAALAVPLPTFLALLPPTHFATVGGKRGWSENRTGHFPHTIQHTSTFLLVEAFLPLQFTPPFSIYIQGT